MNLKINKPIISVFLMFELFFSSCEQEKTTIEKNYTNETDSLKQEIFILKTSLERYEIALDMLKETDPKAANLYDSLLHTKTE